MGKKKKSCFGSIFESILNAMIGGTGTVLDYSEAVSKTVNNCVIGKLDLLPTREDIVIDGDGLTTQLVLNKVTAHYDVYSGKRIYNERDITDIITSSSTLVIPIKKKDSRISDLLSTKDGLLGYLNAVSVWSHVLDNISDTWEKLNMDDNRNSTSNILYLPGIIIPFADYYGHLLKETRTVDVIIVAISSIKNASDDIEEMSIVDYNKKCINDVLEAAIHFNAKNVVTTPVWCKQTDCTANQDLWEKGSTSKRVTDNIRRIDLITPKSGIDVRYF